MPETGDNVPLTRRERSASARVDAEPTASADRPRRRWGRRIGLIIALVCVVLIGAAIWLGFRALTVKTEVEASQDAIAALLDGGDAATQVGLIAEHSEAAASAAGDPVWRVAEFLPVVGDNLRAVRLSAESLELLSAQVGVPALAAFGTEGEGSSIAGLLPVVEAAAPKVIDLSVQVAEAQRSDVLIGQVRDGLDQVATVLDGAAPAFRVLPGMLGADGARNYLLVFQNTAEAMPLGGSAAAQSLIHVDEGAITIAAQTGSRDYLNRTPTDVAVDQSAIDLYTDYLVRYTNTTTSRPDFPTAAQLLRAFWQRDIAPDQIDGVISIDPKALSFLLRATGPIDVEGVQLTSENAEQLLLSDVYEWADGYTNPEVSDGFFAAATQQVFDRVATGRFNPLAMMTAVGDAVDGGDLMMWSADAELQSTLVEGPLGGVLPTSNADATTVGVYFRDTSASKIDYYMNSLVTATASCADGVDTFTASATLRLDITQAEANALPRYVKSFTWGAQKFRTEVFVYGPPGTTFAGVTVDGRDARELRTDIADLGRPVASFEVFLAPDERATVAASFTATDGEFGPLEVRTTPMVRTPDVTVEGAGC